MNERSQTSKKSLEIKQTWFLGLAALAVVLMFSFVILPFVDRKPGKLSGQEVPDFDLELISGGGDGDRVRFSDLRGKLVLIDFWASWCMPCREQSKVLSSLVPEIEDDVYVLGIATSDERAAALGFVEAFAPKYSNAFDEGGRVGEALHVTELPTIVLVDEKGQIRAVETRALSAAGIKALIESVRTDT